MSDPVPPPLPVEKKERRTGRAVLNGHIRFSSVSQIVAADPRQEGGCFSRWWFSKIDGKKEDETDAQRNGKQFALELQRYLTTNYDALSPILRAGKHLLPKPGPDLEVEQELSGSEDEKLAVIALRDRLLRGENVAEELRRRAGLTVLDIPLIGAADYRHYRGEYIDENGNLCKEDAGKIVAEIGDHKTTSRISDHRSASGKIYQGYAKTAEQIAQHPQWLGYGVHAANRHPELTHVRLSANYYQTKHGLGAVKRTSLITVDEVRARFYGTIEPVMREMIDVAKIRRQEDVPKNLRACRAYNKDCPHASYCTRPAGDVFILMQTERGETMTRGLFDDAAAPTNGVLHGVPAIPPAPVMPEAERQAIIAAERERLRALESVPPPVPAPRRHPLEGVDGYTVGQPCNGRGFYASTNGQGFIGVEIGHTCSACVQIPTIPTIGSVNPADTPPPDYIAASDPLTPEAIAAITDPSLRARAEAHAKACAERAEAEKAARAADKPAKKSKWCAGTGTKLPMGQREKQSRKTTCSTCNQTVDIKDKDIDLTVEPIMFAVSKHKAPEMAAPPAIPAAPVAPPAIPTAPPVEATPPPLPVEVPTSPPLPTQMTFAGSAGSTELLAPAVTDKRYFDLASSVLFLNTVFVRGEAPKNLDEYARDLVKTLCESSKVDDLRYVPDSHDLGYGRWRGALAKMVKANPLPPGEYALHVSGSEVREVIAEAVADMLDARVVRGAL